jgi:hypothetical protein
VLTDGGLGQGQRIDKIAADTLVELLKVSHNANACRMCQGFTYNGQPIRIDPVMG